MLLPLAIGLGLALIGLIVVAKVAHAAMTRLGVEFWSVMFWFGLADVPADEPPVRLRPVPVRPGAAVRA